MDKKEKSAEILKRLKKFYPDAKIRLNYGNHIQLLVAVILSAQCTDKKVNEVTEKLFKKYKTARDFACANRARFEQEIKSTGFYRAKAKNIINACKMIECDFGGKLPKTMAEMIQLPGVARKTANIVLGNAYGIVEGIAVDTHVRQFANYCGLSKHSDPNKIEQDLMKLFPKKDWFKLTYMIINHNREMKNRANREKAKIHLKDICPGAPR
ncbi:MAG: endonuclease III [Candidatus Niyogibacteria bacterium RIFCSPHIGHO2_01_FULL_45_28]|uniref:Endonuclease III n=1 Tax=Candidatus Niyogibacteria bacterium RIFCSPLOWO2_02_FULL_45_13 TaxID=1801725 RepID=A0A1G2F102_9BACT|nr:MAG: endonuclease III [Candidatus Niyogibacteria bacterium RIFCSPHIGHO2_01_FULL_45_28]OGZ31258.1 MAG: endonuclease III [Candidatus Niyogibacteria bacterium RIFCSPLOWO2_02_FULL_45_13]